jgi:murein DD-endopeptidase MepM/ murein hydrolase activator NlpD
MFNSKFRITQLFGENSSYYSQWNLRGHEGLDLVPLGEDWNLLSIIKGTVIVDDDTPRECYGNNIKIHDPETNIIIQYCHLEKNFVSIGDKIRLGDCVGVMG